MCWKKLNYEIRGGIITTLLGILGWIIYFTTYNYNCDWDMCGLALVFMVFIALFSIIGLWLLGLIIGNLLSSKKKSWYFYFFNVLGIIIVSLIITYIRYQSNK